MKMKGAWSALAGLALLPLAVDAGTFFALTPKDGLVVFGPTRSPDCVVQTGPADSLMSASPGETCGDAQVGYLDSTQTADSGADPGHVEATAASFTSEPLAEPLDIGGSAQITVYLAGEGFTPAPAETRLEYHVDEILSTGEVRHIDAGIAIDEVWITEYANLEHPGWRNSGTISLTSFTVAAGSRLHLMLGVHRQDRAPWRLLFGGNSGYGDSGITFGLPDTTPEPFSFADQDGVTPGASVTSDAITVSGINDATPVSVSGGTYSIGCSDGFTSENGSISNGQAICLRHTASSEFDTQATTQLTIGGVSATFTSTTASAGAQDAVPDAFTFADQGDVERDTDVVSAAATITGIDTPAPVSVSGGEYSIGCTATFTGAVGSINNGQTVCVRHLSASSYATPTVTTLTIGGVSGTFTSTTLPDPGPGDQGTVGSGGGGGGLPLLTLLLLLLAGIANPAQAGVRFAFTPDPALEGDGGALSPEGCYVEPGLARGALTASSAGTTCHSGQWGQQTEVSVTVGDRNERNEAQFVTAPLAAPIYLEGGDIYLYYYSTHESVNPDTSAYLTFRVLDLSAAGATTIASGTGSFVRWGETVWSGVAGFFVPGGHTIPAGHRLQVNISSDLAPDGRVLFGGESVVPSVSFGRKPPYSSAGITLHTGDRAPDPFAFDELDPGPTDHGAEGSGGGLPPWTLLLLAAARLSRRRRRHLGHPRVRANSFMYSTSAFTPASGIAL